MRTNARTCIDVTRSYGKMVLRRHNARPRSSPISAATCSARRPDFLREKSHQLARRPHFLREKSHLNGLGTEPLAPSHDCFLGARVGPDGTDTDTPETRQPDLSDCGFAYLVRRHTGYPAGVARHQVGKGEVERPTWAGWTWRRGDGYRDALVTRGRRGVGPRGPVAPAWTPRRRRR